MNIVHDAVANEHEGMVIKESGWVEFFKEGSVHAPMYSFSISLSMRLADVLPVNYQYIQMVFQILILLVTQILLYVVMSKLKINYIIKALIVLYFGFSPALINAALSLWYEIIVLPFGLMIILIGVSSFRVIHCEGRKATTIKALWTAGIFITATYGKSIFQYVFWAYLLLFVYCAFIAMIQRNKRSLFNSFIYILISFADHFF